MQHLAVSWYNINFTPKIGLFQTCFSFGKKYFMEISNRCPMSSMPHLQEYIMTNRFYRRGGKLWPLKEGRGQSWPTSRLQIFLYFSPGFLNSIFDSALPAWLPICDWSFCTLPMVQQFNYVNSKFVICNFKFWICNFKFKILNLNCCSIRRVQNNQSHIVEETLTKVKLLFLLTSL